MKWVIHVITNESREETNERLTARQKQLEICDKNESGKRYWRRRRRKGKASIYLSPKDNSNSLNPSTSTPTCTETEVPFCLYTVKNHCA